ncbi:3-deoxy-D-arabinoheptulosonate-7-phosphate synthase [Archangium gephyra]|uniref:Phospho-2-dehydro-3-deoxyheptonate aldolase n=1 Tax=Archangium gephyra TaxID=48 RepID=A0AAC8QJD0_9BACT|nr:3-deoxy-7-phosphoheptulonate synthase class II [Archangium gephyra]AKJ08225.1 2-keto-3-deoxy-D-arabino-heptulosonate-7-phosphate synthase II [Archangium gephyra]REG15339.1 3-deoxy-D-arabinoheptulosonate-7-phosphate synthase [Archangium gephyra]
MSTWTPTSWKTKPITQDVRYEVPTEVDEVVAELGKLPPLVTSWEVERLRELLADAQQGRRFLLQGGDCAESLSDCRSDIITNRQKIMLQMSLVLIHGGHRPVIRVGRIAGQYAKPRSKPTETRGGVELPSYFGDLVNRPEFTPEARRADPRLMLACYHHAAMTLNFVRSLSDGGFADVHHPEYWDLSFFQQAAVPGELREEYEQTTRKLSEALRFMEALGERNVADLSRVDFYTSHEGLNLHYESAQTRQVPWRSGWYDLTTHLPWIGERTRALDGAHVEFFRGIRNPVGVKLGPSVSPDDAVRLAEQLNPENEPGKLVLITRMGAQKVAAALPPVVEAMRRAGRLVLWVCDPMHGNTVSTSSGIKTRNFDDVLREVEQSFEVHEKLGTHLGGVHFELTGEDVTECMGGAVGITERDLERNYSTLCDPRLNYRQALEMSFHIARRMSRLPRPTQP